MPDWTYHTVFRPIGRRLAYPTAQNIAFAAMGRLGRFAVGRLIIRFMGHAESPDAAKVERGSWNLKSPVALGSGVDLSNQAISALSLFGFGLVEVGPIRLDQSVPEEAPSWQSEGTTIPLPAAVQLGDLRQQLQKNSHTNEVLRVVRIIAQADELSQLETVLDELSDLADGVSLQVPTDVLADGLHELIETVQQRNLKCVLIVPSGASELLNKVTSSRADAVIIEAIDPSGNTRGSLSESTLAEVEAGICALDRNDSQLLIAAGGVQQPADASRLFDAGADMVMIDSGFAAAGPGLPKRINHLYCAEQGSASVTSEPVNPTQASWFWSILLGFSLTIGGLMAVAVGSTRVVLPYDEEFLGMAREEICGINPQLLPFMSHDRVTLSGTMLALGPLYILLAWFGDRRGMGWARIAIYGSAVAGFLSFFLFLGFGYFDPFHAFISAILFQFITLGIRSPQANEVLTPRDRHNSRAWKRSLWGQLLMIIQGAAIFTGGLVICGFGTTTVFVEDDLNFMNTTREALLTVNPRLVPLVAHDRASFGGMLLATGVTVFLSCLWGWQQGVRWLWWGLLLAGNTAYLMTIVIHWYVGYTSLRHLLPAYGGLVVLWLAMILSRQWMCGAAQERGSPG